MAGDASKVVLLAHPAGHSLSPIMHNAAFRAAGIDATYEALDVPPEQLPAAVAALRGSEYLGANVTVPHKQAVFELVDQLTPAAAAVGAVNTVIRRGERLVGHNTDGAGFVRGLEELTSFAPAGLVGANCLVLGAGGAARAVVNALASAGASVHVINRNLGRATRLAADLTRTSTSPGLSHVPVVSVADDPTWAATTAGEDAPVGEIRVAGVEALSGLLPAADLLVNTTSVGMIGGPDPGGLPLLGTDDMAALAYDAAVVDLVYRPAVTPLLAAAAARGLVTQNGLPMLIWQGALAFEAWTGSDAPVEAMRLAAQQALTAS